jgi:hypothetical protein
MRKLLAVIAIVFCCGTIATSDSGEVVVGKEIIGPYCPYINGPCDIPPG